MPPHHPQPNGNRIWMWGIGIILILVYSGFNSFVSQAQFNQHRESVSLRLSNIERVISKMDDKLTDVLKKE